MIRNCFHLKNFRLPTPILSNEKLKKLNSALHKQICHCVLVSTHITLKKSYHNIKNIIISIIFYNAVVDEIFKTTGGALIVFILKKFWCKLCSVITFEPYANGKFWKQFFCCLANTNQMVLRIPLKSEKDSYPFFVTQKNLWFDS